MLIIAVLRPHSLAMIKINNSDWLWITDRMGDDDQGIGNQSMNLRSFKIMQA
jgi:hypothetical protein